MPDEILKRDQNHVTVLGGITNDSDQDVTMLRVDPITKRLLVSATGGGGGGFTYLAATGIVNGSNRDFIFTELPTYIVSDGAWYQQLDNQAAPQTNWSWNAGTLTATMTIAPQSAIWGFK